MIVENPEVTLDEEGHGFPEEARDTAMIDWNLVTSVHGDDGNQYWFNIGAMSLREAWGNLDFWQMCVRSERGTGRSTRGIGAQGCRLPHGVSDGLARLSARHPDGDPIGRSGRR